MKIRSKHLGSRKYRDSTVYEFNVYVDDEIVMATDNYDLDDSGNQIAKEKVFSVQVSDDCCEKKALKDFLTKYKSELEFQGSSKETPEIEI